MSKPIPWVKFEEIDVNAGRFVISPLRRGMGITLGNSLRRILLSSLAGIAITAIRIENVDHEFSVIPNVKEDVLDLICNLKGIVFKGDIHSSKVLKLHLTKKGKVFAKDIQKDAEISIINPDHFIVEVTGSINLEIDLILEPGIGYASSESNKKSGQPVNTIYIDSSFSPVLRVNHKVENIRVGKELDFENLTMEVWTNGSINSDDAVKEASSILMNHVGLFKELNKKPEDQKEEIVEKDSLVKREVALNLTIDDLELSARSSNCLKRAGIETVGQLIEKDLSELIKIKNFGKKSADEINEKLKQYALCLKVNIDEDSDLEISDEEVDDE